MIVLVILCLLASTALSNVIITYGNGSNLTTLNSSYPSVNFNGKNFTAGTLYWIDNLTCDGSTIPTPSNTMIPSFLLLVDNYTNCIRKAATAGYSAILVNHSADADEVIHQAKTPLATIPEDIYDTLSNAANNGSIDNVTVYSDDEPKKAPPSKKLLYLLTFVPVWFCLCGGICIIYCCCIYSKRKRSHQQNEILHQYVKIPSVNVQPPGNDERQPIVAIAAHQPQPSRINTAVRQRLSNLSNSHRETQKPLNKVIVDDFLNKSLSISGKHFLCVICQHEVLKDELIMELECKHSFHVDCIREWLTKYHSTCPVCRHAVRPRYR
jgi:hypothetical protein